MKISRNLKDYPNPIGWSRRERRIIQKELTNQTEEWIDFGNKLAANWSESQEVEKKYLWHPMVRPLYLTRGCIVVDRDRNRVVRYYRTGDRFLSGNGKDIRPMKTPVSRFYTVDGARLSFEDIEEFQMRYHPEIDRYMIWVKAEFRVPRTIRKTVHNEYEKQYGWKPLNYWFGSEDEIRNSLAKIKNIEAPLFTYINPLSLDELIEQHKIQLEKLQRKNEIEKAYYGKLDEIE